MIINNIIKEQLLREAQFSANRSSGPGGQNVNKVNTAVELRFSVVESRTLEPAQKERILMKLRNRINSGGELLITAETERSQGKNREQVIRRFFELLEQALYIPKRRKKTCPTASSRLKRLKAKKIQGEKKLLRRPPEP